MVRLFGASSNSRTRKSMEMSLAVGICASFKTQYTQFRECGHVVYVLVFEHSTDSSESVYMYVCMYIYMYIYIGMSLADRIGASQDTSEKTESVLRYFCTSEIVRLKEG